MAVYDEIPITREQLFKIGRGNGYDKKREFESKLDAIQSKTVPPYDCLDYIARSFEREVFFWRLPAGVD
jgi:hypothetical protein